MQLNRLCTPVQELVSLEELKEHMRIEHDDEDSLLRGLQRSAYDWVEQFTSRSLLSTKWCFTSLPSKVKGEIGLCLPFPNLLRIESVNHICTTANKERVKRFIIENKYNFSHICLLNKGMPIEVIYEAGFGPLIENVPAPIRQAIKVLSAHWYENREGSMRGILDTVRTFLHPYQVRRLI